MGRDLVKFKQNADVISNSKVNFVEKYFGIRLIFSDKENPDQIDNDDNDVTVTSLSVEYKKC